MLLKIIQAVLIGAVVWLLCVFGGGFLAGLGIAFISDLGALLVQLAIPIGALAGLWFYFFGAPKLPA